MSLPITARPLDEAVARISGKTPIGSVLRSAEWQDVPLALRERAFFSAGVESARFLQTAQSKLKGAIALQKEKVARGDAFIDRSSFIADMRKIAQAEGIFVDPIKSGTLQDITSRKRLGMIFDIQQQQAQEYARWKAEQDPDVLGAFPAQELIRVEERATPRKWRARWSSAGGTFIDGRMIAMKNDPIWAAISRFGAPWPPFDFNSGMGLEDISRDDAEAWGLIAPGADVVPGEAAFNDRLEASVRGLDPKIKEQLKSLFSDQIDITGDVVRWTGQTAKPGAAKKPSFVAPIVPPVSPDAVPIAPALQPASTPVSKAVQVRAILLSERKRIRETLALIDAVHGDGPLLPTRFNNKVSKKKGQKADGTYYSNSIKAVSVGVRRAAEGGEFHLTHEVGHWLDHIGVPSVAKFASESGGPMDEFWNAATATQAYKSLDAITNDEYREYAKSGRETFARGYAQFIATRSGNPAMNAWLQKVLNGQTGYPVGSQWSDAEFAPISAAIEKLFKARGWMK